MRNEFLWVEKYAPKTIEECILPEGIKKTFQDFVDRGEISKFIDQMPIADSKYIRKFLDENEPKLDLKKTVTAPSGEKLTVNVGFGVDFFRPFF